MSLSRLPELRRMLLEAAEFSEVWDFFLTHFGEDEGFMKLGEPVGDDEFIQAAVREVCKSLFTPPAGPVRPTLRRVPEHQFIHGTIWLGEQLSGVLYFEDVHKGMMAVVGEPGSSGETKFIRFTGRALYDALSRSRN